MLKFNTIVEKEYKNAYESAYDLSLKKEYSLPKIYTANGDLSKRWYVYFSYRDPKTGKLKRQTPIYGGANKYKTKEERLTVLTVYRKVLLKYLREGFNPYHDNTELYNKYKHKEQVESTDVAHKKGDNLSELPLITLEKAFDFDMSVKKQLLADSSLRSYASHIKIFKQWLKNNKPLLNDFRLIDKGVLNEFLNSIMKNTSTRNRNNYRASISSLFSTLEEHEMVKDNIVKKIKVYKTKSKRNRTYTETQQEQIFNHLEKKDVLLLLFIKFVSYNFLRPIEVCRLKVGDIDIQSRTLSFKAKNSALKTKIIPNLLWDELPSLTNYNKEDYLFTPEGIGGEWKLNPDAKRNYFSKRFKRVVKDEFELGQEYGMYSFRHTFITKLYRALVKDSSPYAAKSELMLITGHSSMSALEKYLRDIDAELPEDYSSMIKN